MHVCVFPHGFKGQNESELGPSEGEFDWFPGAGIWPVSGRLWSELDLFSRGIDRFLQEGSFVSIAF